MNSICQNGHVAEMPEPDFGHVARRIGQRLRQEYAHPEAEPLPAQHVDLLLRLRHKERDRARARR